MPELPEVETVRRGLAPPWSARALPAVELRRPNLRFAFPDRFAERLTGARVDTLSRRAKFLIADAVLRRSADHASGHERALSWSKREAGHAVASPAQFHHDPAATGA
jgi:formamidopyrimidine-DNA glycosylase